jgi:hypothetical protein
MGSFKGCKMRSSRFAEDENLSVVWPWFTYFGIRPRARDVDRAFPHVDRLPVLAQVGCHGRGRAVPLCPGTSDVYLLGYRESVVDLNAQIAHCALNFPVP